MKKILVLFTILVIVLTGCFTNTNNLKQNNLKWIAFVEGEKRAVTVVKNGVYVQGATTMLYTFIEFMELSQDGQDTIYANPKAYIVYKDRYIDMVTFANDPYVTAASFLAGTNGVKPVVDESVIPVSVITKSGTPTTSRTGTAATLTNITIKTMPNKLTYNIGEILDVTGLVITGSYSDATTKDMTINIGNITGFESNSPGTKVLIINVDGKTTAYNIDVKSAGVTYKISSKNIAVFGYISLKMDLVPKDSFGKTVKFYAVSSSGSRYLRSTVDISQMNPGSLAKTVDLIVLDTTKELEVEVFNDKGDSVWKEKMAM